MLSNVIYIFFPWTSALECKHKAFGLLWNCLNLVGLWCATWLSVFISLKFANSTQPFFSLVEAENCLAGAKAAPGLPDCFLLRCHPISLA